MIAVPSYFKPFDIKAMVDSAKIAGINKLGIIKEHEAIAVAYAYSKYQVKGWFDTEKTVCFIDLGLSSASITLAKYSRDKNGPFKATIISESFSKLVGTRNFDDVLIEKFIEDFQKETSLEPRKARNA